MLINRIERSVDIMLEGLDACNVPLMLEAVQEFDDGVKTAAKIAQEFVKILEKSLAESKRPDNTAMPKLIDGVKKLAKDLSKVDTSKAPSKFSFKVNLEMRDGDGDDAVAKVTQAAASLDVLYNGTKDAIIGIAQILDPEFKEVFSVGSNGIVIAQEFAKDPTVEESLTMMDVARGRPLDTVMILSGDNSSEDAWKQVFDSIIKKGMQDPENAEQRPGAEENFLKYFQQLKDKLEAGMKSIASDLQNIEPNEDLKQATQETGFLKSLLKSKNPYQMDNSMAEGILQSVSMLTLKGLVVLTQGLVGMTKEFEGGIGAAVLGVKTQAKTQDADKMPKRAGKLVDELANLEGIDEGMAAKILALGEAVGYDNEKHKDFSSCKEQEALVKEIKKVVGDGDIDGVIKLLNLKTKGEDETDDPNKVDQLVDAKYLEYKEKEGFEVKDALEEIIKSWVNQLSDRQQEVWNNNNGPAFIESVCMGFEGDIDPEKAATGAKEWVQANKLDDPKSPLGNDAKFSPNELNRLADMIPDIVEKLMSFKSDKSSDTISDSIYRRWSVLAGIIKG